MKRRRIKAWLDQLRTHLALDFGSANTRLMVAGELVWHEPTLLAWHQAEKAVVVVGTQAAQLAGKTSQAVQLVKPVESGVIADLKLAKLYLQAIFEKRQVQTKWYQLLPQALTTAVSQQSTPLEEEQLKRVLSQVGCRTPSKLKSKTQVLSSLPDLSSITGAHGVLAIGAETFEVGIFSEQTVVQAASFATPQSQDLTQAIQKRVLSEYGLRIDWQTAQWLKHELGAVRSNMGSVTSDSQAEKNSTRKLMVKGKHAQKQTVATAKVAAASLTPDLQNLVFVWSQKLKQFLQQVPPAVMTQLQEHGFYLTGGGSQLQGLDQFLTTQLQLPIIKSQQPELDLVQALASSTTQK